MQAKCVHRCGSSAYFEIRDGGKHVANVELETHKDKKTVSVNHCSPDWHMIADPVHYKTSSHIEALKQHGATEVVFNV